MQTTKIFQPHYFYLQQKFPNLQYAYIQSLIHERYKQTPYQDAVRHGNKNDINVKVIIQSSPLHLSDTRVEL